MIEDPAGAAIDPERALASYRWDYDPDTLREVVTDPEPLRRIREGLTSKIAGAADHATRARLLGVRAVVSRVLGDLDDALRDGRMAVTHAETTGQLRRVAIAQVRLAHVHQWLGEYDVADRLYATADSPDLPDRLRAAIQQHAATCCFEQRRYIEACAHLERALELRRGTDPELIASTEMALDAVVRKVTTHGWGPFSRTPQQILSNQRQPLVELDTVRDLYGYVDDDGKELIAARYADAYPFHDGVAWVRLPAAVDWELIDEAGRTLLDASQRVREVGPFGEDLAWVVCTDGDDGYVAIDRDGTVVIPGDGYDEARMFDRGLAVVRRGRRWGVIDRTGQVVVPLEYDGFLTAFADGRYLTGFTAEGLAVVGHRGRRGVIDRTGRVLVEPVYHELYIHPVAYLVVSDSGTSGPDDTLARAWGALDRDGKPLIEPAYPNRKAVLRELEGILADSRPAL